MAYIGRDTDKISNVEVLDNITFDGSSSYTLQKGGSNFTPSSANTILLSIDGVVQAGNFTVSGSTIDFGTAVAGTSTCDFILHYGVGLITTPADGTVSLDKLSASGTKDATTFLRGDNTFAEAGGTNTPAFEASLSAHQSINDNGNDKVQFDIEILDTDNAYDNSTNYRFTPQVAGKYYVALSTTVDDGAGTLRQAICRIYKNGSSIAISKLNFDRSSANNEGEGGTPTCITIVDMNGSSDYLEGFVEVDTNDGGTCNIQGHGTERTSRFSAYKLIGV